MNEPVTDAACKGRKTQSLVDLFVSLRPADNTAHIDR